MHNQAEACRMIERSLARPSAEQLDEWIAALHAATKHRTEDSAGLALVAKVYRAALIRYPADIVRRAVWSAIEDCEWFPTVKELLDPIKAEDAARNSLATYVRRWAHPAPAIERQPTQADLAMAEAEQVRRKLGVVGNVAALSPERRALFDRLKELDVLMRA